MGMDMRSVNPSRAAACKALESPSLDEEEPGGLEVSSPISAHVENHIRIIADRPKSSPSLHAPRIRRKRVLMGSRHARCARDDKEANWNKAFPRAVAASERSKPQGSSLERSAGRLAIEKLVQGISD